MTAPYLFVNVVVEILKFCKVNKEMNLRYQVDAILAPTPFIKLGSQKLHMKNRLLSSDLFCMKLGNVSYSTKYKLYTTHSVHVRTIYGIKSTV